MSAFATLLQSGSRFITIINLLLLVFPPGVLAVIRRLLLLLLVLSRSGAYTLPTGLSFTSGQGHSDAKNLPLTWSETENVVWKVPISGLGWSSPSIQGQQIWLTTAIDNDKSLHATAIDRTSGRTLHDVEVFRLDDPGSLHKKNSHASPTPLIEDNHVCARACTSELTARRV